MQNGEIKNITDFNLVFPDGWVPNDPFKNISISDAWPANFSTTPLA